MATKIRVTTEYIDTETGEVLTSQSAESDNVPYEAFDFSTKAGILVPFGSLEGTLLGAGHASMTGATQKYMEAIADSKKKQKGRKVEFESLIGRFEVWVEGDLASGMNSRERLVDCRLVYMLIVLNGYSSYRNTVDAANGFLVRLESERLAYKTTSDFLVRLGKNADKVIDSVCSSTLEMYGFDGTTALPDDVALLPPEIRKGNDDYKASIDAITQERIDRFNALESHKSSPITPEIADAEIQKTEDPANTTYASFDDACTKSQKTVHIMKNKINASKASGDNADGDESAFLEAYPEYAENEDAAFENEYAEADKAADLEEDAAEADREDHEQEEAEKKGIKKKKSKSKRKKSKKTKKRVWHTNAQVIDGKTGRIYRFHARGKLAAVRQVLAFMLKNDLLRGRNLVFLTDGADDIRALIAKYFSFHEYRLIVDWYHVTKKCNEHVSMALKCKLSDKRAIKKELFARLWIGQVAEAIAYLSALDVKKDDDRFSDFVGYLTRKSPYVPCYALRKMLNLHISSQFIEKTNDLIVSARQKHNGMSWSWDGGCASATLRTMEINGELENFLLHGTLAFEPIDPSSIKHSFRSFNSFYAMAA